MTTQLNRPVIDDGLFLWIMHRFAEVFTSNAIPKGGMALRLIDGPRSMTDLDHVFVPYKSSTDIRKPIADILSELEGVDIQIEQHSKMLRAEIRIDETCAQLEVSVATECSGIPMPTGGFARRLGPFPAHIVRIMSQDWAFAHRHAAWNERRLLRDLNDRYSLAVRLSEKPAAGAIGKGLAKITFKLPCLKQRKQMSRAEHAGDLRTQAARLTQA